MEEGWYNITIFLFVRIDNNRSISERVNILLPPSVSSFFPILFESLYGFLVLLAYVGTRRSIDLLWMNFFLTCFVCHVFCRCLIFYLIITHVFVHV